MRLAAGGICFAAYIAFVMAIGVDLTNMWWWFLAGLFSGLAHSILSGRKARR